MDKILDQVQSQNLKSSIIEKDVLVIAVKECTSKEKGTVSTVDPLTVINAFETPRLTFSVERKKYLSDEVGTLYSMEITNQILVNDLNHWIFINLVQGVWSQRTGAVGTG